MNRISIRVAFNSEATSFAISRTEPKDNIAIDSPSKIVLDSPIGIKDISFSISTPGPYSLDNALLPVYPI